MVQTVLFLGVCTVIVFNVLQALGVLHHPNMLAFSFECLVSMIVVCCPCSIGLASALVSVQALALLNARGVILRKDSLIEDANRLTAVVFDKTGTLVDNHLVVADMHHEFNIEYVGQGSGYKLQEVMLDKDSVEEALYTLSRDLNHPVCLGISNA